MRVDKYLWCVRYLKTRSMATQACKKGAVRVNGDIVKPSREVYPGDEIVLRKNQIKYQIKVLDIPDSRLGAKLVDIYRKDITPREAFEAQELSRSAQEYYRQKGEGRPTKKDRRDLDDFIVNPEEENPTE